MTSENNPTLEEVAKPRRSPRPKKVQIQANAEELAVASTATEHNERKARNIRTFPAGTFDEAADFAKQIFNLGSGTSVRRLTLFNHLNRAPDSGPSRALITNASKYGLLKGSYKSDFLELTLDGKKVCDDATNQREAARSRVKLAVQDITPFNQVYQKFTNAKLPPRASLIDSMREAGVTSEYTEEAVDILVVNLKSVGLLQNLSGADRVVTVEHLLDSLPGTSQINSLPTESKSIPLGHSLMTQEQATFESTCFYIAPIGLPDSEARKHSNLFFSNIVEPAVQTVGLTLVRADHIDKPGMITRQTIEYIMRSRLVVADLSFSNANVFYELALRHAARLPIVQIIQFGDPIPFDINQMRTIVIDNRDIYTLLPNVEAYRSEIASQARSALAAGSEVDTPISINFPSARLSL